MQSKRQSGSRNRRIVKLSAEEVDDRRHFWTLMSTKPNRGEAHGRDLVTNYGGVAVEMTDTMVCRRYEKGSRNNEESLMYSGLYHVAQITYLVGRFDREVLGGYTAMSVQGLN